MIYASESCAKQVADEMNVRKGHPKSKAVLTEYGWTVIASWSFGMSGN